MKRGILPLTAALLLSACGDGPGAGGETVTIYRDAWHTPQVFADSNRGVFYGYGYAVATDRLFQMEMLKRTAEGRVAEALGDGYLELDRMLRTSYDHRSVRRQLEALPPAQRRLLQAYAEGFNARVAEVLAAPERLMPVEFPNYGFAPEPWTDYDVAMAFVGSIVHRYADFNSERDNLALLRGLEARLGVEGAWSLFSAGKWLLDDDSPVTVPDSDSNASDPASGISQSTAPASPARPAYLDRLPGAVARARVALAEDGGFLGLTSDPALEQRHRRRLAREGFSAHPDYAPASNYWAMRGLQDAPAALLNGPQFGFSTPGYVYGIGLHGGDFDAVGNTLLALPNLLFAHNNHIAWGSTAGISDQSDEYALALDPDNPERYRHGDGWREFERWEEEIAVAGAEPVRVTARRAAQGMVQRHLPAQGVAWVRARAWEGAELDSLMAWIMLATERDLDGAHRRIGAMAININMYTMDRAGNLGYVHAGRYPRRAPGHDPRLPAPGDGAWDWQGLRPYADNPSIRNPAQGYIANWNNRPRRDWISSDLWSYTWSRADRSRLLFDALEAMRGGTVAQLDAINRRMSYADVNAPFVLPVLFAALDGEALDPPAAGALQALRAWDRQWRPDARGRYGTAPAVMEAWLRTLLERVFLDDVGEDWFHLFAATNYPHRSLGPSMPNPPGIKALLRNLDRLAAGAQPDYDFFNGRQPEHLVRDSFLAAVQSLAQSQGANPAAWRLTAHPMEWVPYNFRGVPQAAALAQQSLPAYLHRGSENNLFVATGTGIEARDVLPPGQSGFYDPFGRPGPHVADQMKLYADFAYKPVPFTREAVAAAAVETVELVLPD